MPESINYPVWEQNLKQLAEYIQYLSEGIKWKGNREIYATCSDLQKYRTSDKIASQIYIGPTIKCTQMYRGKINEISVYIYMYPWSVYVSTFYIQKTIKKVSHRIHAKEKAFRSDCGRTTWSYTQLMRRKNTIKWRWQTCVNILDENESVTNCVAEVRKKSLTDIVTKNVKNNILSDSSPLYCYISNCYMCLCMYVL